MSGTDIVKVQRHISASGPPPLYLVYGRGIKHMQCFMKPEDLPSHVIADMGEDYRAFFEATWTFKDGWKLLRRVPDDRGFR